MTLEEKKKGSIERWNLFLEIYNDKVVSYDSMIVKVQCNNCNETVEIPYNSFVYKVRKNSYNKQCSCSEKSVSYRSKMNNLRKRGISITLEELYKQVNEITETPKCKYCERDCRFVSTTAGYSKICGSKECVSKSLNEGYINKYGKGYDRFRHAMEKSRGISYIAKDKSYQQAKNERKEEQWIRDHSEVLNQFSIERRGKFLICKPCGEKFELLTTQRVRINQGENPCTTCNPILNSTSKMQQEITDFIKSLNVSIKENFNFYGKQEIDIFIENLRVGFEFNGLYWHSEQYKDRLYHSNKSKLASSCGIKLYHIWEDEWIEKRDIVKSRIRNILQKNEIRIQARKCKIEEIPRSVRKDFFNKTHIQGDVPAEIALGLIYENKLVAMMSFGKTRNIMGRDGSAKELLRYSTVLNANVIGGPGKLFKKYLENNKTDLISYSHNHWGEGNLYKMLGFSLIHESPPNYFYVVNNERKHRYNFRKSNLVKEGFDALKTEHEIMKSRNIYRIYDCGCKLWKITNNVI